MDIEELVRIVEYDKNWPAAFIAERQNLARVLEVSEASIEHIGSTAVPGMIAKPIVDIMLGLSEVPPSKECVITLVDNGYEFLGESGVPDRYYFRRRGDTAINLHVVSVNRVHWNSNLVFRDYLRANLNEQIRYTRAKRKALANGNTALSTYSEAKELIVSDLLDKASKWRQDT